MCFGRIPGAKREWTVRALIPLERALKVVVRTRFVLASTLRAWGLPKGIGLCPEKTPEPFSPGQGAWLILTLNESNKHSRCVRVPRARRIARPRVPYVLSTCASHWTSWLGHAPGVEQFGEPLFREDFLFFGHLAHGLA